MHQSCTFIRDNFQKEMEATSTWKEITDTDSNSTDTVSHLSEGKHFYSVEDRPAWPLCILFGLQQAVLCLGSSLSVPFIITNLICAETNVNARAELLSIAMFCCGVGTILQTTIGVRLGIIQGGSHSFIAPIVAMMTLEKWKCPSSEEDNDDAWKERLREIQGNLILASMTQILLGCTGLMGLLLRFIGPLTIAPTISLIGLSLTRVAADFNKVHWGIASLTFGLVVIFTLFLKNVTVPCFSFSRQRKCFVSSKVPIFQLLPVILSICICWLFCYTLTVTDALSSDPKSSTYFARTDARIEIVYRMPWFYFPYPLKFGKPTFSLAGYIGMLAATITSIVESVGDYFAAARISNARCPPQHAVNRGIAIEGISSVISGLLGSGHATTSYSGNVGAIGITQVASRIVFQIAGFILLVGGILGKVGAILTLIPDPVVGGIVTIVFGMVGAVGISALQHTDLSSSRNLTILAMSLILGLMVPEWMADNPKAIKTGSESFDQVVQVLLSTAMFVGGFVAFLLDNLVPGTNEERGILRWRDDNTTASDNHQSKVEYVNYDFPYITKYIRRVTFCTYIPVSPTFNDARGNSNGRNRNNMAESVDGLK